MLIPTLIALTLFVLFVGIALANDKGRRSVQLALRSLWLHKLRSFLSVLGIIIGTGAVIALMAFGEGNMQDALEDIKRQGATNVMVRSVKPLDDSTSQRRSYVATYGITKADYDRFLPLYDNEIISRMVPMRVFPQEIRYHERMTNGRLVATTPEYAEVNQLTMHTGRFIDDEDNWMMKNIAVLGSNLSRRLFPFEEPLGKTVKIGQHLYLVVGVVRERIATSGTGGSQAAEDFNNDVYIPILTCRARFGERVFIRQSGSRTGEKVEFSQVTMTVRDIDDVRSTGDHVRSLLERHTKKDWEVTVPLDKLEEAERAQIRGTILLVMIASISLLVGGIGIMNIMLATVTERTREIGIRRALGAKRRDITLQFLIEAVVQTTVGGLLGILSGLLVILILPPLSLWLFETRLPAKIHVPSIFLSLGVSVTVGVLFGWFPARRASCLDPIEALRHV